MWTLAALFWCIPVDSCSSSIIVLAFFAFLCSTWVWPICIQMLWGLNMANQAPSSAFVSCMRRLLISPRDSKKRWAVNCDRCKFGDNDKSIHLWDSMNINELNLGDLFVFCFVIDLAGPISSYSRSRCGPESSRATTALGRGQLRQSRFEQTRTCLRTFAMSCY